MEVLNWKIGNFSFCDPRMKKWICSPCFKQGTDVDDGWVLKLCPRDNEDGISISLCVRPDVNIVSYKFGIVGADDRMQFTVTKTNNFFIHDEMGSYVERLAKRYEIRQKKEYFLPNDTLTVRCEIRHFGESISVSRCTIRTQMRVCRIKVPWDVCKLDNLQLNQELAQPVTVKFRKAPSLEIVFKLKGETLDASSINISLKKISHSYSRYVSGEPYASPTNSTAPQFEDCGIVCHCKFFLNLSGRVEQTFDSEHYFERSSDSYSILLGMIGRHRLYSGDTINHNLSMRFELAVSDCEHISEFSELETYYPKNRSGILAEKNLAKFEQLYRDKEFCDVTLKTSDKELLAHKAVLCSGSPVFKAMFKNDTAERVTCTLNVDDVDGETLDRMLLFLYSGVLGDVGDYKSVIKLYIAADKYLVSSLKEECSDFLMCAVSSENAFEILCLASNYHDETLKNVAQGYICENPIEALDSEALTPLAEDLSVTLTGRVINGSLVVKKTIQRSSHLPVSKKRKSKE